MIMMCEVGVGMPSRRGTAVPGPGGQVRSERGSAGSRCGDAGQVPAGASGATPVALPSNNLRVLSGRIQACCPPAGCCLEAIDASPSGDGDLPALCGRDRCGSSVASLSVPTGSVCLLRAREGASRPPHSEGAC